MTVTNKKSARPLLLVDDDLDDMFIAKRALRVAHVDADVRMAGDGEEAWQYLCHPDSPRPRLVLLDLNMPRLSGLGLLARMKGDPDMRDIPVVILSTSSNASDVAACYDNGANTYIAKPLDFDDFVDVMATIGHYWLDVAELPDHA